MYVIDGFFLVRQTTGIQRFARNMLKEMDKIAKPGQLQLLIPEYCPVPQELKNIEVVKFGNHKGYFWEQTDLARYLRKTGYQGIFMENAIPVTCRRGIAVLHDISMKVNSRFFATSPRGIISTILWKTMYRAIVSSNMHIVTVSEFSASEITRVYGIKSDRLTVIYNSWQHITEISENSDIIKKMGLTENSFYFSLSTAAPNKNIRWIFEAAKRYPNETFVITGKGTDGLTEASLLTNVVSTGYLDDSSIKALMKYCKAFIFPTFYEGFGLPPLEAAASGAKQIIVSDTPCMHEIYGDSAYYIDPYDYKNINLPTVNEKDMKSLLNRYAWEKSAKEFMKLLK